MSPSTAASPIFACTIPLTLYVHLPWCVRKCPYCDFNSHPGTPDGALEQSYVRALLADLELDLPRVLGRRIESVFLGGGTPSLFSPESMETLLSGIRSQVSMSDDCEITIEANPGTAERERFRGYRELGINRLSLGVQSFQDQLLTRIGRIHDGDDANEAAAAAVAAGFSNLNLDLMFGLPGQSVEEAARDVERACALEPSHISHYQLTVEPNTEFAVRPPKLPEETLIADIERVCARLLRAADYTQYEVSAYAREGWRCHHNLNYWRFGDYLGIGAGAHSKLTDPTSGEVVRRARVRQPKRYLAAAGKEVAVTTTKRLATQDLVFEFALNALRLNEGFAETLFEQRTGLPPRQLVPGLKKARSRNLVETAAGRVRTTPLGRRFLNDVVEGFMGGEAA